MIDVLGGLNEAFQYLSGQRVWWGLSVVACAASLEYLVPPFPGDTVTVAAAVLIPKAGWPLAGVFGALLLGTAAGATVDWWVGRWLASSDREGSWIHAILRRESVARRIDTLHDQFDRWGPLYLSLNRFVPAFRALFFVAAGHAGLALGSVLVYGLVGAAIYNAALLGLGYAVGYNLELLASWIDTYSTYFLIGLGIAAAVWLAANVLGRYRE